MKITTVLGASVGALALLGLGLAPVAEARPAVAYECAATYFKPGGHVAQTTCYRGPGNTYALQGQACGTSSCVTITSSFVFYGNAATLNAGSGYIVQSSVHPV